MTQRILGLALAASLSLTFVACRAADDLWYRGDFAAATATAAETNTLVMLDFYTDWCSWCRRLDEDTFSDQDVRARLRELVPMRVNAEKGGESLAERFSVNGYPTIVFVNGSGDEVDRLVGYFPPDSFLDEMDRIRTGDTFAACLHRLDRDPADLEALQRSVDGLLERADPTAAIARLEAYHQSTEGSGHDLCQRLMFAARSALLDREYAKAVRHYRRGSDEPLEVPREVGTEALQELTASDRFSPDDPEAQADALRQARLADAGALLATVPRDALAPDELVDVADFAYANGHFDLAGTLYGRWFDAEGDTVGAAELNRIAWRMYLMHREIPVALAMAERAYELDASPDVADTVARLLYLEGRVEEAIELQTQAADSAADKQAETFRDAVAVMKAGETFDDRPSFAFFPGERE